METSNYSVPEGEPAERALRQSEALGDFLPQQREDGHRDAPPANPTLHVGKHRPAQRLLAKASTRGSSLDLYSPGFPQKIQGRVRFVGRDVARNRIIFKLFLLQPDAGCPFFPGGQPLLPKVWRAGKLNPTCSVLFSARGGKRSQNPMFKT